MEKGCKGTTMQSYNSSKLIVFSSTSAIHAIFCFSLLACRSVLSGTLSVCHMASSSSDIVRICLKTNILAILTIIKL